MSFERTYAKVDPTSSAYRRRVMVEITPEMDEMLTEFRNALKCPEAKAVRLATITGLRTLKNSVGWDVLRWAAKKERARK